jgi:single-strand DNA-binding protein
MSASLNEVRLLGNLGTDPELKNVGAAGDKTVASFRLATNKQWTDGEGKKQTRTEWHNIEVWGAQAKTAGQFLKKGRQVLVLGELRHDEWEKEGQKHFRTKIVAGRVVFLGAPPEGADVAGDEAGSTDEIPF